MSEQLNFESFSCPQVGLDHSMLELVAVEHAQQVLDLFLQHHETLLHSSTEGLSELLCTFLPENEAFRTVWDVAFGDIYAQVCLPDLEDVIRSAVAAGLRLSVSGHPGDWQGSLPTPSRLRVDQWLLPETQRLRVFGNKQRTIVEIEHASKWHSLTYERQKAHWTGDGVERLPTVGNGFRFTMLNSKALFGPAVPRLLPADAQQFGAVARQLTSEWRATCEAAIRLLDDAAQIYAPWVGTVVKELIPVSAKPGIFTSGSDRFSPGIVCVSDHNYHWPLAELLVHEATHQYLNLAARIGPLVEEDNHQLYYSPLRDKERPLFFIIVAYHAAANNLLFYRLARERGFVPDPDSKVFADREPTLERHVEDLERHLRGNSGVTPLGRALWEPLSQWLHA